MGERRREGRTRRWGKGYFEEGEGMRRRKKVLGERKKKRPQGRGGEWITQSKIIKSSRGFDWSDKSHLNIQ